MVDRGVAREGHWRRALASGFAGLLLIVAIADPAAAAQQSWSVMADRLTVPLDSPATVTLTITNTSGGGGGGDGIACVTVAIPTAYAVTAVDVASVSNGRSWSASVSGSSPRGVEASADSGGDRLRGDPDDDVLVLKVHVTGTVVGLANWTANEFQSSGCHDSYRRPVTILMTILGVPVPTPKPTPKPSPTPPPTATPAPTPTRSPSPTATPTATPDATPTPTPTRPGATPTPTPGTTPDPTATPDRTSTPAGSGGSTGGQGGTGAGTTGTGGSSGSGTGGSDPARPAPLDLGVRDPVSFRGLDLGGSATFGAFEWVVPGALLTGPGLLLLALIAAQAMGALAWLPLVRRKIGGFGPARRGRPAGGA